MSLTYINLRPGALVPPRATLRATFGRTVYAVGGDADSQVQTAYRRLAENLPGTGVGYVASPLASSPGADNFTVDIRRSASGGSLAASQVATVLTQAVGNLGPDKFALERLALVGGESAADASAGRDQATTDAEAAPSSWETVLSWFSRAASWTLWVGALVLAGVLLYLARK